MSVGGSERGEVADKVLFNYVFTCRNADDVPMKEEIETILGNDFSVGDVRDYFFRVRNPGVYERGRVGDLVFPFRVNSNEGRRVYGVLRSPFFDVVTVFGYQGFNSCSIRAAVGRDVFKGVLNSGSGIIVANRGTIADFMSEDEVAVYDDLYARARMAV